MPRRALRPQPDHAANAGQLGVAWAFSVGSNHGQEAAPIVVGDTLYVVGAYPNELFALDSVTGDLKWKYSPHVDPASQGVACCDVVNRGEVYDNGKIFFNTLDNHTVAIDAKTGQEVWAVKLGEITRGMTLTMAPLAVKGKILVGNSGGEMGVRGWVTALDESDGHIAWRAYSVGPDKDVLIGPKFHPYYKDAQGKDLGVKTWPPGRWQVGGGPVWGWLSYDPATNLIFYGTGNPGPWNSNQRQGDNLWTTTIFARDADTGEAVWADVLNPHDLYDYDEINENLLLDLPINGRTKQVIVHPGRDGLMFVIDRQTGQIYSADKYDTQTSMQEIRSQDPGARYERRAETASGQEYQRHLSRIARREGLATHRVVAADASPLYPAPASLHGLQDRRGRLYRGHALCGRHRRYVCGSRGIIAASSPPGI